jgi:ferredoxin
MKVVVDVEACIASGACLLACPEVFDQDDDGVVVLRDATPPEELALKVDEAVGACPAACIWLETE